jgi:predicted DNA-binding WGR domain protein
MPRYEFGSSKFWEIELAAKSFTCRFGKLGANGQTTLKTFGSDAEAKAAYDKLIAEKTKKGYELAGKPAKSAKTVKAAPSKTVKSATPAGQYFEFKSGGSSKFWEITLAGKSFTTRFISGYE